MPRPLSRWLILALLVLTAVFADFLAPHDPTIGNLRLRYRPPVWQERGSAEFILGTDHMGRDVLSRIIYGSRISLIVATIAVLSPGPSAPPWALSLAFVGGWVDQVVMRLTDAWLALPAVTFAILLAVLSGRVSGISPSSWGWCTGHAMRG